MKKYTFFVILFTVLASLVTFKIYASFDRKDILLDKDTVPETESSSLISDDFSATSEESLVSTEIDLSEKQDPVFFTPGQEPYWNNDRYKTEPSSRLLNYYDIEEYKEGTEFESCDHKYVIIGDMVVEGSESLRSYLLIYDPETNEYYTAYNVIAYAADLQLIKLNRFIGPIDW